MAGSNRAVSLLRGLSRWCHNSTVQRVAAGDASKPLASWTAWLLRKPLWERTLRQEENAAQPSVRAERQTAQPLLSTRRALRDGVRSTEAFARPKAFRSTDLTVGKPVLDAYRSVNQIFKKSTYTDADKAKIVELLVTLDIYFVNGNGAVRRSYVSTKSFSRTAMVTSCSSMATTIAVSTWPS